MEAFGQVNPPRGGVRLRFEVWDVKRKRWRQLAPAAAHVQVPDAREADVPELVRVVCRAIAAAPGGRATAPAEGAAAVVPAAPAAEGAAAVPFAPSPRGPVGMMPVPVMPAAGLDMAAIRAAGREALAAERRERSAPPDDGAAADDGEGEP